MNARQRMLAAYRHEHPMELPVSPELWDATAIAVSGRPFHELVGPFAQQPWWQTHLAAFQYFGADAWIVPGVGPSPCQQAMTREESRFLDAETIETRITFHTPRGDLHAVSRTTPTYAGWLIEHPVKRLPEDLERYLEYFCADPEAGDLSEICAALDGVGDAGLVTPYLGEPFTSFLCGVREGGVAQALSDLLDHAGYLREVQARYIEVLVARARHVLRNTRAQAAFVNGNYAALPMVSPALFRAWDVPVLQAIAAVCRAHDVPLHLHQHGRVYPIIEAIIAAGVSVICPLLPPPQGDVDDLGRFSRQYGQRIALKGNVDPFVLLNGTPQVVEREVRRCIEGAAGSCGYILGTADSTLIGTPFENIHAFVAAGRKYGRLG
jgi:hypothetical protein